VTPAAADHRGDLFGGRGANRRFLGLAGFGWTGTSGIKSLTISLAIQAWYAHHHIRRAKVA
jgi:hypothetical protein